MEEDEPQDGAWLPLSTAARRLGISPRALRGRIDRGTVQWRQAGNAGKLVLIRPEDVFAEEDRDTSQNASQEEIDRLREELMKARLAMAKAEAERDAAKAIAAAEREVTKAGAAAEARLLREALEREQARADWLDHELAELRRPWFMRWFPR